MDSYTKEIVKSVIFVVLLTIIVFSAFFFPIYFLVDFENNQTPTVYYTYEGTTNLYQEDTYMKIENAWNVFDGSWETVWVEDSTYHFLLETHNDTINCEYHIQADEGMAPFVRIYYYHNFVFPDDQSVSICGYYYEDYFKVTEFIQGQ